MTLKIKIFECDKCELLMAISFDPDVSGVNYCPNCGLKHMRLVDLEAFLRGDIDETQLFG